MAETTRKTKHYPSDLTDDEWERIAYSMPKPGRQGRPREVGQREIISVVHSSYRANPLPIVTKADPLAIRMPPPSWKSLKGDGRCVPTVASAREWGELDGPIWVCRHIANPDESSSRSCDTSPCASVAHRQ
jgi:hypothetical protein